MSFWRTFGFHTVSAVDTLLDSGEYTLEQLLDEEEILQETKSQNRKLIDFLVEKEQLTTLLSYITQEPPEEAEQQRRFKYPFIACEILASEVWAICDAFYEHEELLNGLYAFLEQDPPLNPVLTSYSCRVAGVLLSRKVAETIAFLKSKKDIIGQFVKHLGNPSVMDLLLKVISCEDPMSDTPVGTLEWLCTTDLIPSLVKKLDPQLPEEITENAAQGLVDIINVSSNNESSPLIKQLEGPEMVELIIKFVLVDGFSPSLLFGLTVFIELIVRHTMSNLDDDTPLDKLPPLLNMIVNNLDKFTPLLTKGPQNEKSEIAVYTSTVGEIQPLGFHRLRVIEFLVALVLTNFKCINAALIKLDIFNTCLNLFFSYSWNNFLHASIVNMMDGIFLGKDDALKIHILTEAKLLDRICKASKDNDEETKKEKGLRKGYMGHVTKLSATIVNSGKNSDALAKVLSEHEGWQAYINGAYKETNERENSPIGEYNNAQFPDEEGLSDEEGHEEEEESTSTQEQTEEKTEKQEEEEEEEKQTETTTEKTEKPEKTEKTDKSEEAPTE